MQPISVPETSLVECTVCLDHYLIEGAKRPMVLACGHSVCQACCASIKDDGTGCWHCPMRCAEPTRTEPKPNFALLEQLDVLQELTAEKSFVCPNCDKNDASLYCLQCKHLLCSVCAEVLHTARIMQSHVLCPCSEVRPAAECLAHGEPLKYVCLTCNVLECTDCKDFDKHKGHKHDLLSNVAKSRRRQLRTELTLLDSLEQKAAVVSADVERCVGLVGANGEEAKHHVEQHFAALEKALAARKAELLSELEDTQAYKLAVLQDQQSLIGEHRSSIRTAKFRAEAAIG